MLGATSRKTVRRILFMLLAALIVFVPIGAPAEESRVVRVGYYENEVFEEGAADGAVKTGYAYEYYQKLTEYTGWSYEYVYGTYGDLYQMLVDGKIDFLAGLAFLPERLDVISYPESPMGHEAYNLLKHRDDERITTDPITLSRRRIGVLNSAIVQVTKNFLEERRIGAEVVPFDDSESLFAAFDGGEVDVVVAEGDGAYGRVGGEVLYSIGTSDYYLCVNKRQPELLKELDLAQEQLEIDEPNYLSSLRSKYYSSSVSSQALSSPERRWIAEHHTLRVGYLDDYLPYSDIDEGGEPSGIVRDLMPHMLDALSIESVEIVFSGYSSYDQMVEDLASGEIDVAFPVGGGLYYAEESGIYQSSPVVSAAMELVYAGTYDESTTLAHFAVNENNRMQYYYIKTYYPDSAVTFYGSIDACLKAVLEGEASCTTLNGLRANGMLKNSRYTGLSMSQLAHGDDRCMGVRIGEEGLLKLLNRGVNVVGSDYVLSLASRYASRLYTYTSLDFLRDNLPFFALLVCGVVALVIHILMRDVRRQRQVAAEKEQARAELEEKNAELEENRLALSEALAGAERANRAKTTFLNSMSHDIRTPMNAIVGFTALAQAHLDEPELVSTYLNNIAVSSQHLLELINDVLDMSRIESGKVTIEPTEVNIPSLIHDIETIVTESVARRGLTFEVDASGIRNTDVRCDRLRLSQVLINILSNAIKFTPEGGSVWLVARDLPEREAGWASLEFRIRDTGIGMSEEFLGTIFETFTRENTSTVSGIEGTGLGMAITKSIVDLMGGTISVTSTLGEGSEFTVRLRCEICEPAVSAEEIVMNLDFTGRRILLAEDNVLNQQIAEVVLTDAGFQVEVASDGTEAVAMVEEHEAGYYDLILMDIQMPQMDGYEATRRIRALPDARKSHIPIIAVTANAFAEDRRSAEEAGMNGHLAKPYDVEGMELSIMRALSE